MTSGYVSRTRRLRRIRLEKVKKGLCTYSGCNEKASSINKSYCDKHREHYSKYGKELRLKQKRKNETN